MPKEIESRRVASKTRKSLNGRNNEKRQGCKIINECKTSTPRIIANSLFALTLKEKSGIEVSLQQQSKSVFPNAQNDIVEMYYDLLNTFQHSVKIFTGETTSFDPYANGMSLDESILFVINSFKSYILPFDFELNIDHHGTNGYHFTVFKEIESAGYWITFEVKPILRKLRRTNLKLHDFFIIFVKSFMDYTGIQNWYNGGLGYAEYAVEEHIEEWEHYEADYDNLNEAEKERRKRLATIWEYNHGEVKDYQSCLTSTKSIPIEELQTQLSSFNKRSHIVRWMYEALEFIKIGGSIYDFIYEDAISEDYNEEGVRFEQQQAFIWDSRDIYTLTEEEVMDAEAQGCGIQSGFLNIHISKNTESIDWSNINLLCTWVDKLHELNQSYIKLINAITRRHE